MTGPEHYRAAEEYLYRLAERVAEGDCETAVAQYNLAKAQVHATLAVAAATALQPVIDGEESPWRLAMKWAEVTA